MTLSLSLKGSNCKGNAVDYPVLRVILIDFSVQERILLSRVVEVAATSVRVYLI